MRSHFSTPALVLALAGLLLTLVGCGSFQRLRFGMRAMGRDAADYDSLDEARSQARAAVPAGPAGDWGQGSWPQYRGARNDGIVADAAVAAMGLDWREHAPELLWAVPVGPGYASIVVGGGLVLTAEQRRESEAVVAFTLDDGAVAWEHAWDARFYESLSKEGPRATPAIAGDRVVALGAAGELRCLELGTGALVWRRALIDAPGDNLTYGLCASPIVRDRVVLAQGGRSVFALDLGTGNELWRALDETLAYATPQVGPLGGRETVVVCAADRVVGLALDSGEELWSFDWKVPSGNMCTQPILLGDDGVLVSAGYGKGSKMVRVGTGDPLEVWRSGRLKSRFSEPVLLGDYVYGLDEGTLVCFDPRSGQRLWKQGRYGYGQLLALGTRLVVTEENGTARVVEVTPVGPVELGDFQALDSEMQLQLPATAHGRLFVRNHSALACFDLALPME